MQDNCNALLRCWKYICLQLNCIEKFYCRQNPNLGRLVSDLPKRRLDLAQMGNRRNYCAEYLCCQWLICVYVPYSTAGSPGFVSSVIPLKIIKVTTSQKWIFLFFFLYVSFFYLHLSQKVIVLLIDVYNFINLCVNLNLSLLMIF